MSDVAVVLMDGELLHDYAFRVTRERDEARADLNDVRQHLSDCRAAWADLHGRYLRLHGCYLQLQAERDRLRALLREVRAEYVRDTGGQPSVKALWARVEAALEGRDE